ncbi:hypothetical protein GQ457_17G024370 [Hibiscus cannabinus]
MESKENLNDFKDRTAELELLELESDDNINAAIKTLSLVGKIVSDRNIKFTTLCAILNRAWPIKGEFESHNLGKNFVLFVFNSEKEKQDVLLQGPWSILDKHIVLKDWPPNAILEEIDFSLLEFWIQIYNLPLAMINEKNAAKIGNIFPKYLESNIKVEDTVKWDDFLKIKIAMRVNDPLKTGFKLKRGEDDHILISFKYERMPKFCYECGRMGHPARECGFKDEMYKNSSKYGPWLRASSPKKTTVFVANQKANPVAGVLGDKLNNSGRCVESLPIEERQIVLAGKSYDNNEKELTQSLPLKPFNDVNCHVSKSFSTEILRDLQEWSFQIPSVSWIGTGNEDFISRGLKEMDISSYHKRKRELEDILSHQSTNKKLLREKILDEVVEIEPGIWKSSGSGLIENEVVVNFVFSPGIKEEPSKIISRIEKKFKGKVKGSRRLSGFKQAAREKFAKENDRKFDDETGLLEFGRDPFGKRIINIPTFSSSPSLSSTKSKKSNVRKMKSSPCLRMTSLNVIRRIYESE